MTSERRLVVGIDDIKAVTCECRHCGVRLSMTPDKMHVDRLSQCPHCGHPWLSAQTRQAVNYESDALRMLYSLGAAIKTQSTGGDTSVGVRILFEFDELR